MGRYKTLTLSFGFLPFLASVLLARLEEGSSQAHQWLTIVRKYGSYGAWTYLELDTSRIWKRCRPANDVW